MKNDLRYRHELKYELNSFQLEILRMRLPPLMKADRHTDATGTYVVRSVYFDDLRNSCYYENENGYDNRKKFRIRTYNHEDSFICLELKHKNRGMTYKKSCILTKEIAEKLARNEKVGWQDDFDPLLKRLLLLRETAVLAPKVIVEYDRTPFVYPDGNVRITLDQNIRASRDTKAFFESDLPFRPIMPLGRHLLEVKYDEFLPDYIHRNLTSLGLRQTTFSKYYYCRKIGGLL